MTDTHETLRAGVVFRKQVSDGNYGSEVAEVALDVPLGDALSDDLSEEAVAATLEAARRLVHAELARSPNNIVRLNGALRAPVPSKDDDLDDLEDLPL